MEWSPIAKRRDARCAPNLADYELARREFSWAQAASLLEGLPGGALNIAHEAVSRHVRGAKADRLAIRFLARDVSAQDITYRELNESANRFANVLGGFGVERGERFRTKPKFGKDDLTHDKDRR